MGQPYIPASKLINLLKSVTAQGDQPVWIHAPDKLGIGYDQQKPHCFVDLATEKVLPGLATESNHAPSSRVNLTDVPPTQKPTRKTGKYLFDILGKTIECTSLKHMLGEGLREIERERPGMLSKLSNVKLRTKRIVAHKASELFDQPELSKKYAERLTESWWFGTNNSAVETNAWLERACGIAELRWGKEFTTTL